MLIYKYAPKRLQDFQFTQDMHNFIQMLIQSGTLNIILVGNRKTSLINAMLCQYYDLPENIDMMNCEHIMYVNNISDFGVSFYRQNLKTFCQSHFKIKKGLRKTIVLDNIDCIKTKNIYIQQICYNLMETYGDRINFVLSCTNLKKVIENIQSHSLILSIPSLTNQQLTDRLKEISVNESIVMEDNVMNYLLSVGKNNINVLVNYLEKFKLFGKPVSLEDAYQMCTNISFQFFDKYLLAVENGNLSEGIEIMNELIETGYSVIDVLDTFFLYMKSNHCCLVDEGKKYNVIALICKYIIYFNTIQENDIDLYFFTNNLIKKIGSQSLNT